MKSRRWLTWVEFEAAGWRNGTRFVMLMPASQLADKQQLRLLVRNNPQAGHDPATNDAWDEHRNPVWLGFAVNCLFQKL